MESSNQKLLTKGHHAIATVLTLGVFVLMSIVLRDYTFSPNPLVAQFQASFTAFPITATFWFACNMFLVVLSDQRKQRSGQGN